MPTQTSMKRRSLIALALASGLGIAGAQPAAIRFVVPYPAGGVTDQAARLVADQMSKVLGQTVIVDNRPGAVGRIGIDAVVKASSDASTLLFTNSSYTILPIVDPKSPYDPLTSLQPIAIAATYGLGIVLSNKVPANTLAELIAYARANPGKLSYGSAGPGSGTHFAGEFFKSMTGTNLIHIPYKSTTAALNDVAAGILDLTFDASAKPLVDAGRVKLLAIADDKRDPRFPNVPTTAEAGLKGFLTQSWVGLLAPAGTPAATVERLNKAMVTATADAGLSKRMHDLGLMPQGGTPEQFTQTMRQEQTLYRKIATDGKIQFE